LRLKSEDRTYLFITVIKMDEPQYARTERGALLEIELAVELLGCGGGGGA
jgi:hypothetical protein